MRRKLLRCIPALVLLSGWLLWGNTALAVNTFVIEHEAIPSSFDGFRIAQVSDLHNTRHWENAVSALKEIRPDLIVLTGDLIDSRNTDVDAALEFVREAVQLAPCFYVSGNHEARSPEWPALRRGLLDAGVGVLENEGAELSRDGETVTILGLSDPDFGGDTGELLRGLTAGEGYTILLSHRPELFDLYAEHGVDLVFSGHAHGGQVRLPLAGGIIAPHQGFFPQYDAGLFRSGSTAMLVSRGVGNSIIPLRINNRPEILVAELKVSVGISYKV